MHANHFFAWKDVAITLDQGDLTWRSRSRF